MYNMIGRRVVFCGHSDRNQPLNVPSDGQICESNLVYLSAFCVKGLIFFSENVSGRAGFNFIDHNVIHLH